MIRIDLGHDQLEKSAKAGSGKTNVEFSRAFAPIVKRVRLDIAGFLTLLVGAGVSALFPLFLQQYKTFVIQDYSDKKQKLQITSDALGREIGKLTPYQKELESYEMQKKLVASRLAVVRELLTSRNTPILILDAVGQNLPRRTWVNSVELVFSENDGSLVLQGSSYSNEEIADFVDKLTGSVYLKDVALEDVTTRMDDKVEVRGFQVTARSKDGGLGSRGVAGDKRAVASPQVTTQGTTNAASGAGGGDPATEAIMREPNSVNKGGKKG